MSKFAKAMDWQFVSLQLMQEIAAAKSWHHISIATEALFHARLRWKAMERERAVFEAQNGPSERAPSDTTR